MNPDGSLNYIFSESTDPQLFQRVVQIVSGEHVLKNHKCDLTNMINRETQEKSRNKMKGRESFDGDEHTSTAKV